MAVTGIGQAEMCLGRIRQKARTREKGIADASMESAPGRSKSFLENMAAASKEEEKDAGQAIHDKMDEIYKKVLKGENQQSFQIGASSFTLKEWDRFLEKFDDTEEEIGQQLKEALEEQKKAALAKVSDKAPDTAE